MGVPFFGLMAGKVVSPGNATISINYEISWQEWAFGTNFDCDVSEVKMKDFRRWRTWHWMEQQRYFSQVRISMIKNLRPQGTI